MASGDTRQVVRGFFLVLLLNIAATIAVAIVGGSIERGGAVLALPFMAFIGAAQWIYLGPFVWFLRRRGSRALAGGVLITAAFVTIANLLFYGGIGVLSLNNAAETRRVLQYEREHPSDFISTDGVVTAVDDSHFEFRRDTGEMVSLQTFQGLDYIFLKKDGGFEKRTRDILKPGVRVAVDYSQDKGQPPVSASIVRVYEEGAVR